MEAYLAQSPLFHKSMAISADLKRVFLVSSAFRAEPSNTSRHLTEFTMPSGEMEIMEHYSEVIDIVDKLFVAIFDSLNETCGKDLDDIRKKYPAAPLKQALQNPQDAGTEIDPHGDLTTDVERELGRLVLERFDTDFFILDRFPTATRSYSTMACPDDPEFSNSFDVFLRVKLRALYQQPSNSRTHLRLSDLYYSVLGEEIMSGAEHIYNPRLLADRAKARGVDLKTIESFIFSKSFGAPPGGGFGAGLERILWH